MQLLYPKHRVLYKNLYGKYIYLDRVVDEANLTENFSKNEIASLVIEDWVSNFQFSAQNISLNWGYI